MLTRSGLHDASDSRLIPPPSVLRRVRQDLYAIEERLEVLFGAQLDRQVVVDHDVLELAHDRATRSDAIEYES